MMNNPTLAARQLYTRDSTPGIFVCVEIPCYLGEPLVKYRMVEYSNPNNFYPLMDGPTAPDEWRFICNLDLPQVSTWTNVILTDPVKDIEVEAQIRTVTIKSNIEAARGVMVLVLKDPELKYNSRGIINLMEANGYDGRWTCGCSHDCCGHPSNLNITYGTAFPGAWVLAWNQERNV